MLDENQAEALRGQTLSDAAGEEVGPVEEVFLLPGDDQPGFAAVSLDGDRVLVPLDGSTIGDAGVQVRYERAAIEGAPGAGDEAVGPEAEAAVYAHYGIDDSTIRDDTGFSVTAPEDRRTQDASGDPRGGSGADDASQGHP